MLRTVLIVAGVAVAGYVVFTLVTGSSPAAVARTLVSAPAVPPSVAAAAFATADIQRKANTGAGHF